MVVGPFKPYNMHMFKIGLAVYYSIDKAINKTCRHMYERQKDLDINQERRRKKKYLQGHFRCVCICMIHIYIILYYIHFL